MRNDLFLKSDVAKNLYDAVRDLPIVDYHCHLSPKEILEDREFPDIAQIWPVSYTHLTLPTKQVV